MFHLKNRFFFAQESGSDSAGPEEQEELLEFDEDLQLIVMVDTETGDEFTFEVVDHFEFSGQVYTVLVTEEDENGESEWIIARVVDEEDGELGLESLTEEEGERVYEEYERLLAEELDEEADSEE